VIFAPPQSRGRPVVSSRPPNIRDFLGMGSVLAVLVAGGLVLGWFADNGLHTTPLWTLLGLVAGIVAASFYLYSVFRKFSKD
jgi:F0F1-type ATP synthase assembly protein I